MNSFFECKYWTPGQGAHRSRPRFGTLQMLAPSNGFRQWVLLQAEFSADNPQLALGARRLDSTRDPAVWARLCCHHAVAVMDNGYAVELIEDLAPAQQPATGRTLGWRLGALSLPSSLAPPRERSRSRELGARFSPAASAAAAPEGFVTPQAARRRASPAPGSDDVAPTQLDTSGRASDQAVLLRHGVFVNPAGPHPRRAIQELRRRADEWAGSPLLPPLVEVQHVSRPTGSADSPAVMQGEVKHVSVMQGFAFARHDDSAARDVLLAPDTFRGPGQASLPLVGALV